jgi:hypothetical protein
VAGRLPRNNLRSAYAGAMCESSVGGDMWGCLLRARRQRPRGRATDIEELPGPFAWKKNSLTMGENLRT